MHIEFVVAMSSISGNLYFGTIIVQQQGLCEKGIDHSEHVMCHKYVYAEQVQICLLSIQDNSY